MRGDVIFQVFGVHDGRQNDVYFGAFATRDEAQVHAAKLGVMHGPGWAERHHNHGFVIRETTVTTDFSIPLLPKPRDKYFVTPSAKPNRPGTWDSTRVEVFRRGDSEHGNVLVGEYVRNYAMLQTFEPFRQGDREFALISREYSRTAILDLASGAVIAEEASSGAAGNGFCPVGFYVPDWWDLHDGSKLPGSKYWSDDDEWPVGGFGFVWGCIWGDDSSWKVQYLDLSRVQEGVMIRDERFGYVELATAGHRTPCLTPGPIPAEPSRPAAFISISKYRGPTKVTFAVEMGFDLSSGRPEEWQRLRVENFE